MTMTNCKNCGHPDSLHYTDIDMIRHCCMHENTNDYCQCRKFEDRELIRLPVQSPSLTDT